MADSISADATAEDPLFATIEALAAALPSAWSIETSSLWSSQSPARGQCSVTSLVAQDLFGGEILKTWTPDGWHFYNRIDGRRVDLTEAQFAEPPLFDDLPASRDDALRDTSAEQYTALMQALRFSRM
jgi:hypothetical protein